MLTKENKDILNMINSYGVDNTSLKTKTKKKFDVFWIDSAGTHVTYLEEKLNMGWYFDIEPVHIADGLLLVVLSKEKY